jgi:hypothetical protein
MKWLKKIKIGGSKNWSSITNGKMDSIIDDIVEKYGKEFCLNIGAGKESNKKYTTVDLDKKAMPTMYGDIRCLFVQSPEYKEKLKEYPELYNIQSGYYVYVRFCHIVEHIEWIYVPSLFDWIYNILATGGLLTIDTPNLEFIAKAYLKYLEIEYSGENPRFPAKEHGDLSVYKLGDMQRWINFKIFSGCSPGDYHHSCIDKTLISRFLHDAGFDKVYINNGSTLRVLVYKGKKEDLDNSLEHELAKITGGVK